MKAICVRQPWAFYLAKGIKTIEYRTWCPYFRGNFILVASSQPDPFFSSPGLAKLESEHKERFALGCAIAEMELISVEPFKHDHLVSALMETMPAGKSGYAWHVKAIRKLDPFPVKGKLKFFDI